MNIVHANGPFVKMCVTMLFLLLSGCQWHIDTDTTLRVLRASQVQVQPTSTSMPEIDTDAEPETESESQASSRQTVPVQTRAISPESASRVISSQSVAPQANAGGPYLVSCDGTVFFDGRQSLAEAGLKEISWTAEHGMLERETTLTPTYTPDCAAYEFSNYGGKAEEIVTLCVLDYLENLSCQETCVTILKPYDAPEFIESAIETPTTHGITEEIPTACFGSDCESE